MYCHLNMAQSATSKQCPFCNRVFVRLGNRLKHCPERQGQDQDIQKTVVKHRRTPPAPSMVRCLKGLILICAIVSLSLVDATLVTSQQKVRLFRDAVCLRLTWDLSLADLPISWVEKNLDTLTTRYLKRWTGQGGQVCQHLSAKEQRWPPGSIYFNHLQKAKVCQGSVPDVLQRSTP